MIRTALAIGLATVSVTVAGQDLHKCTNNDGKARYTKDKYDVRVGEQCRPLTPKEIAQRKAEANRPPTSEQLVKMNQRAASI